MLVTKHTTHGNATRALRDALTTETVAVTLNETNNVVTAIQPRDLDGLASLADLIDWRCGIKRFALSQPDVTIGLRRVQNGTVVPEMHTISLMDAETFFQSNFDAYDQIFSIRHAAIPVLAAWLAHFTERITYAFFEPDANDAIFLQDIDVPETYRTLTKELDAPIEVIIAHPGGTRVHLATLEQVELAEESNA